MIEGLKPTVPGPALLELVKSQMEFHQRRAAFYSGEAKKLSEMLVQPPQNYSSFRDPRESLGEKVREHENAASKMEFIAKYLDLSENYRLTDSDLHSLGVGRGRKVTFDNPPF